jgi:DNA-directed RNA polymerase subunit RPC12/RpoP
MDTIGQLAEEPREREPVRCPGCASARVRPFVPLVTGVEYRCRDCGRRWAVSVSARDED